MAWEGTKRGDYASRVVVDSIAILPPVLSPQRRIPAVRNALHRAHAVIKAEADSRHTTIGATVVASSCRMAFLGALWAGDSRRLLGCAEGNARC